MMGKVKAWAKKAPSGVPYIWTTLVFAVIVMLSAPPQPAGSIYLDTHHADPFVKVISQQIP